MVTAGVWSLAVGALTLLNVGLVRAAYHWEQNRSMSAGKTFVLVVLLLVAYAISAIAIETG